MPFKLDGAQDATDVAPAKFKLDSALDADPPKADAPGFTDRLSADLLKRANTAIGGEEAKKNLTMSLLEGEIGGAKDFGKEAAQSAWNYTPDTVKDPLNYVGRHVAATVKDTSVGRLGGAVAKKGAELAQNHPLAAARLDAATGLVGMGATADAVKGAKTLAKDTARAAGPVLKEKVGPALEKKGENLIKGADKDKEQSLWKAIRPKQTQKEKEAALEQEKLSGVTGQKETVLNDRQKEAIAEAKKAGISNLKSSSQNRILAKQAREKLRQDLVKTLSSSKNEVPHELVSNSVNEALDKMATGAFMPGNVEKIAKFKEEVGKIISSYPPTPMGLYQARIKLDQTLKKMFGDKVFDAETENFNKLALKTSRDAMNSILKKSVPVSEELLKRQSLLYDVTDNLKPRAAGESGSAISRNLERAVNSIPGKGKLEKGVVAGLGGAGLAGAGGVLSPAAAVPIAAYGGYKAATSPTAKKVAGKVMSRLGKDLKGKEAPKLLTQDRPMVHVPGEGTRPMTDVEWQNSADIRNKYDKLGLSSDVLRVQDRNTIAGLEKKYGQSELGKFIAQNHNQPIMGRVWETPYTEYNQSTVDKMMRNSAWEKLEKSQKQQIISQIEKAWNEHKTPIADMILQARKGAADLAAAKKESFSPTDMQEKLLKAAQTGTSLERVARDMQ